jgi:hypothetical protein
MKIIILLIITTNLLLFITANKFSVKSTTELKTNSQMNSKTNSKTHSKSSKMMLAESLLNDYQNFYNKANTLKSKMVVFLKIFLDGKFGNISEDQLVQESKTLDMRYNDLLKVFTETSFLEKGRNKKLNMFFILFIKTLIKIYRKG